MTPGVTSVFVAAKRSPQNVLPPIPTNSLGQVPTPATLSAAVDWRSKESGTSSAAVALFAKFLVCATFRLQKPKIKKQPYYCLQ